MKKFLVKKLQKKVLQRKLSFEEQLKVLSELAKQKQAKDYGKSPDGRYHLFIVADKIAIFADYQERNFKVVDKREAFEKVLAAISK